MKEDFENSNIMMQDCQQSRNRQKLTFFLGLFDAIRVLTLDVSRVAVLLKAQKPMADCVENGVRGVRKPHRPFPVVIFLRHGTDRGSDAA